jgi:tRNA(Glu) U13 pseudouridine synthase TruD
MNREGDRVTISAMPRSWGRVTEKPEGDALDEAARAFKEVEAEFESRRLRLILSMVKAKQAHISVAEIGRRTGYTREHASRLISEAERELGGQRDTPLKRTAQQVMRPGRERKS